VQLVFKILSWGAWTPDFQNSESWTLWSRANASANTSTDSPKLAQVPAMQRRRFSRLTKMMLSAAFDCDPKEQCRSIFASRHGELTRTLGLLEDIIAKQPLSPMAFSQSVHNTASGIFGIVNANTSASTSIAAGEETLPQALIEAYAQLAADPNPLLLVFGDDPVPPVYNEFINEIEQPFGFALYLAPFDENESLQEHERTLTLTRQHEEDKNISLSEMIHHLACKKSIAGNMCHWHWSLNHA
jgi:hypothetical protein